MHYVHRYICTYDHIRMYVHGYLEIQSVLVRLIKSIIPCTPTNTVVHIPMYVGIYVHLLAFHSGCMGYVVL